MLTFGQWGKETGSPRKGALPEALLLGGTDAGGMESWDVSAVPAPWKGVRVPHTLTQDREGAEFPSLLTGILWLILRWAQIGICSLAGPRAASEEGCHGHSHEVSLQGL